MTQEDAETSDTADAPPRVPDDLPEPGDESGEADEQTDEQADPALAEAACPGGAPGGKPARRRREGAALVLACGASVVAHAAVVAAALLIVSKLRSAPAGIPPADGEIESGLAALDAPAPGDAPAPDPTPAPTPDLSMAVGVTTAADPGELTPLVPAAAVVPADPQDPPPAPVEAVLSPSSWDTAPSFPGRKPSFAEAASDEPAAPAPPSTPAGREGGGAPAHSFTPARVAVRGGGRNPREGFDERGLPVPEYPPESRRRREQGVVELEVEVLSDGSVGAVKAIGSPKYPRLVQAAVAAVRRGAFEPATLDGKPAPGRLTVPFRFVLE